MASAYVTDASVVEFVGLFSVLFHERELRRCESQAENVSATDVEKQSHNRLSLRKLHIKNSLGRIKRSAPWSFRSWRSSRRSISSTSSEASKYSKGSGWMKLCDEVEKKPCAPEPRLQHQQGPIQYYWAVPIIF